MNRVLVTGAGGFIGHHLIKFLKVKGYWVRGVDIKYPKFEKTRADEFKILNLIHKESALKATYKIDYVYNLAADMGGMGFISKNHAKILYGNTLINLHMLNASVASGISKFFFSSSACVYPDYRQDSNDIAPLKEEDAFPAELKDAYGWEKLYTEQACRYYRDDYNLHTKIARFHNVFGPLGAWEGGREKAPAALCRKIAIAKSTGNHVIDIWGDGEQTRSFLYIDDCLEGIYKIMQSPYHEPINIGQDRMITINKLVDIIADIAGISVEKNHIDGPQGVRGRNSDNTLAQEILGWTYKVSLEDGLKKTYNWIENQIKQSTRSEVVYG